MARSAQDTSRKPIQDRERNAMTSTTATISRTRRIAARARQIWIETERAQRRLLDPRA
jgi:hypothetical protein